jgi:hypothetical protein
VATGRPANQLFVEGKSDKHVVIHVVRKLRPSWDVDSRKWGGGFEINDKVSGDEDAFDAFKIAAKGANARIGLVIDADDQAGKRVADRWRRISVAVSGLGAAVPPTAPANGWVATTGNGTRLGTWIMPDNVNNGALEAFVSSFAPGDGCWTYAKRVVRYAKTKHAAPYSVGHEPKARLHTWLAWRAEPGRPFGIAIRAGDLDPAQAPIASRFADWFERLFVLP